MQRSRSRRLGTGIAGALYVPLFGFVSPGAFPLHLSILLYFAVIVGGGKTLIGPIAGIYLLYILPNNVLTGLVEYRLLVYGVIAFCIMYFFPDGLVGRPRVLRPHSGGRPRRGSRSRRSCVRRTGRARRADTRGVRADAAVPVATKSFGAVKRSRRHVARRAAG